MIIEEPKIEFTPKIENIHWNYRDKKWNLKEFDSEIDNPVYRCYIIDEEFGFIDPRKSWLVRIAYKIHCLFNVKINSFYVFSNERLVEPYTHKKQNP